MRCPNPLLQRTPFPEIPPGMAFSISLAWLREFRAHIVRLHESVLTGFIRGVSSALCQATPTSSRVIWGLLPAILNAYVSKARSDGLIKAIEMAPHGAEFVFVEWITASCEHAMPRRQRSATLRWRPATPTMPDDGVSAARR
jgi:hypothetical protein